MNMDDPYTNFIKRLELLIGKHADLVVMTLGNIFTMRLIGNKTHGDLAEIAIAEFINQYMYDFRSVHVGKDLYRAKSHEEDIKIIDEITKTEFPVSLKAYGVGPLQLSTDKSSGMFSRLNKEKKDVIGNKQIQKIFQEPAFAEFQHINILPLIYDEKNKRCNILVFDYELARNRVYRITRETSGSGRRHPVFKFYDAKSNYVCEVRYGDATANALQRGLWTNTKTAVGYFNSVTNGWINYSHNIILVKLFSHALVASESGHAAALKIIKKDIVRLKKNARGK